MRYVAFLRGINVNGRKITKDDLLTCFSDGHFRNIITVAQTGNVIFEVDDTDVLELREKIESLLYRYFNVHIAAILFPIQAIKLAIDKYPFTRDITRHAYLVLTDGSIANLLDNWPGSDIDKVAAAPLGIYWSVPKGMTLDSPFAMFLANKKFAHHTTTRNINTLEKIIDKVG